MKNCHPHAATPLQALPWWTSLLSPPPEKIPAGANAISIPRSCLSNRTRGRGTECLKYEVHSKLSNSKSDDSIPSIADTPTISSIIVINIAKSFKSVSVI